MFVQVTIIMVPCRSFFSMCWYGYKEKLPSIVFDIFDDWNIRVFIIHTYFKKVHDNQFIDWKWVDATRMHAPAGIAKLKMWDSLKIPRGITLPKIIQPNPNSNFTCVFSWQTYVPNFIWKYPRMTEIIGGHWILNDEMTEGRKGVTLFVPAISWRGGA